MTMAKLMGSLVAVAALACAGSQAETRPSGGTASAQPRDTDRGNVAVQGATGTTAGATAAGTVKELDEVYGQVTKVSGDEIEVEPAYGDSVKLKIKDSAGQANVGMLKEGDEVRASYDDAGGDKVIVDLKTGNEARPIDSLRAPDTQYPASSTDTTMPSTSGSTSPSRTEAGQNSGNNMSGSATTR